MTKFQFVGIKCLVFIINKATVSIFYGWGALLCTQIMSNKNKNNFLAFFPLLHARIRFFFVLPIEFLFKIFEIWTTSKKADICFCYYFLSPTSDEAKKNPRRDSSTIEYTECGQTINILQIHIHLLVEDSHRLQRDQVALVTQVNPAVLALLSPILLELYYLHLQNKIISSHNLCRVCYLTRHMTLPNICPLKVVSIV